MKSWRNLSILLLLFVAAACGESEDKKKEVNLFESNTYGTYTFEGAPNIATIQALDFGDVPLGTTQSRRVEIRNTGRDTLKFEEITISPDFELHYENGEQPIELEPGRSTYLTVFYLSIEEFGTRGTLDIATNDPDTPVWTVTLAANIKVPCMVVSTQEMDFGLIDPGEVRTQSFFLENCSEKAVARVEDAEYSGDPEFVVGRLRETIELQPGERFEFQVIFQPARPGAFEGRVRFITNDDMHRELTVDIRGLGRSPDCPVAVIDGTHPDRIPVSANPTGMFVGVPLDRIQLDASRSFDPEGGDLQYSWSMISRPTDSNSVLEKGPSGLDNEVWLDLAGEYVVELEVLSEEGLPACETARLTLRAIADEDIHLQLVWDTPNDPNQDDASGSDVDIHFLQMRPDAQWNSSPWDCFWMNMEPAWGLPGQQDDPSLDRDDVDGLGPENINMNNPEANRSYSVGVHYFSDHNYGNAFATVRVYIGGVLFKEVIRKSIRDQDFWHVADISWPGGQITDVDTVTNSIF